MKPETQQVIQDAFANLPQKLQDAILSLDVRRTLKDVYRSENLTVSDAGALENEVMFVLLGITPPNELFENIWRHTNLSPEETATLIDRLNEKLFVPLRSAMRNHAPSKDTAIEETLPATPKPPQEKTESPAPATQQQPTPQEHMEQKLTNTVHTPLDKPGAPNAKQNEPSGSSDTHPYASGDPYREPIT